MDHKLSRRRLLQAGATAGLAGLAGCVGKLPQEAQCLLNRPSYTFAPADTLDSEKQRDAFAKRIKARATVAHKKHGYLPDATVAKYDADIGATTLRFSGGVEKSELTAVITQHGKFKVTTPTQDGVTTLFQSKGYRRQTRLKQRENGWSANVPLSPKEKKTFQQRLRETGVVDAPADHPLTIAFAGKTLREVTLTQAQADRFVSEKWDGSLIVTTLSRAEAVGLSTRFNGGPLPVAATLTALC